MFSFALALLFKGIQAQTVIYEDFMVNHEESFKVEGTFSTLKKSICAAKCTLQRNQCYASEFDEDTKICLMGKLHPMDLSCHGHLERVSIRSDLFEPKPILQWAIFNPKVDYYAVDFELPEPADVIPKTIDWMPEKKL